MCTHVRVCVCVCVSVLIHSFLDPTLEDPGSLAMARAGPQSKSLFKMTHAIL